VAPRFVLISAFVIALAVMVQSSVQGLKIDPNAVSITGFSSGAYFATHYQFAHSASLVGAAIFAGGPYYCAMDSVIEALEPCMTEPDLIFVDLLVAAAYGFAAESTIDSLTNLQKHKILVFSGTEDTIVVPPVVQKLIAMYTTLKVPTANMQTVLGVADEHGFPTTAYGNACNYEGSPWVNKCGYDGAGAALQQIYGTLNPPVATVSSNLFSTPQSNFVGNGGSPKDISLGETLYFYVPTACQNGTNLCKLHLVFHGCKQYADTVGTVFVEHSGHNAWAESNNIVVVYPQTTYSEFDPYNPNGCWDWWGYNDSNYANQQGSQIQFVNNVITYFLKN